MRCGVVRCDPCSGAVRCGATLARVRCGAVRALLGCGATYPGWIQVEEGGRLRVLEVERLAPVLELLTVERERDLERDLA